MSKYATLIIAMFTVTMSGQVWAQDASDVEVDALLDQYGVGDIVRQYGSPEYNDDNGESNSYDNSGSYGSTGSTRGSSDDLLDQYGVGDIVRQYNSPQYNDDYYGNTNNKVNTPGYGNTNNKVNTPGYSNTNNKVNTTGYGNTRDASDDLLDQYGVGDIVRQYNSPQYNDDYYGNTNNKVNTPGYGNTNNKVNTPGYGNNNTANTNKHDRQTANDVDALLDQYGVGDIVRQYETPNNTYDLGNINGYNNVNDRGTTNGYNNVNDRGATNGYNNVNDRGKTNGYNNSNKYNDSNKYDRQTADEVDALLNEYGLGDIGGNNSIQMTVPSRIDDAPSVKPSTTTSAVKPSTTTAPSVSSGSHSLGASYSFLTSYEKQIYDAVYNVVKNRKSSVTFRGKLNDNSIDRAVLSIKYDHPELIWFSEQFSIEKGSNSTTIEVTLNGLTSSDLATFKAAANEMLAGARGLGSDLAKEKYIFEKLHAAVSYGSNSLDQTAYSALVLHQTVCAGFSMAFKYLMNELGIVCYVVTGSLDGGEHAWNIIKIDGKYYNVDVTSDLNDNGQRKANYNYFNQNDSVFRSKGYLRDSERDGKSIQLPACN